MEQKYDFLEISLLKYDNQLTNPMREKEFYEWLRFNSRENILSIPELKYKIDKEVYSLKVERSIIMNKWDAQSTYQKTNTPRVNFTFDWKRDPDFRIDFERKLEAELEKVTDDEVCVCKERTISKEVIEGNRVASEVRLNSKVIH